MVDNSDPDSYGFISGHHVEKQLFNMLSASMLAGVMQFLSEGTLLVAESYLFSSVPFSSYRYSNVNHSWLMLMAVSGNTR